MTRYLCNLLIPGAPKSGTSSLHALLDKHPAITMSRPKEQHHFSRDSKFANGAGEHNTYFAHRSAGNIFGESSTLHCISETAAKRASDHFEDARIIFLLRDPIERVISHYNWLVTLGIEARPFLKAIRRDGNTLDPEKPIRGNYMGYLLFSRYASFVPMWIRYFGQERVLVLRSEDLKRNQQAVLNRCFSFLGVEQIEVEEKVLANTTKDLSRVASMSPLFIRAVKKIAPGSALGNRLESKFHQWQINSSKFAVSVSDRTYIEQALQPDVEFFQSLSGSEFSRK